MFSTVSYITCLAAAGAAFAAQSTSYPSDSEDLNPAWDLNQLGNNSLYTRWRPTFHVLAPGGHMNDPCGPMYDSLRDTYHIFYQSFPQHVEFGNTSWSHAISTDGMVTWTDVQDWRNRSMVAIATGPYAEDDWIGAFSGGAQPVGLNGQTGNLTLAYTGASHFPDNWKLPYAKGTEVQNLATSADGGLTWQKYEGNPIIKDAPGNWNVTGFRDPVFGPQPNFDKLLGYTEPHYYLVSGSGIRGIGPRIPLYSAKASDLTQWQFLGALFEPGLNQSFGGDATVTGNFAYNFELAGIYYLTETAQHGGDNETEYFVANMGSEGFADRVHPLDHWSLYALGSAHKRQNQSIEMNIQASGVLDWGNLYALNSFNDTKNNRRVIWGWSDEDINNYGVKAQGFQGSLGLPREAYIKKTTGVVKPHGSHQDATDIWQDEKGSNATFSVISLAHRPLPDVVAALHRTSQYKAYGSMKPSKNTPLTGVQSDKLHLRASAKGFPESGELSVRVRESPGGEEWTQVNLFPGNSSVTVDRTHSSLIQNFTKTTFVGHFKPFEFANHTAEDLQLDVFVDGSLVEVFLNDRFALTTRVYPSRTDALGSSVAAQNCEFTLSNVEVWQGLKGVWPKRPVNASSPLVFDAYYETHVLFENPYVEEGTQLYDGY